MKNLLRIGMLLCSFLLASVGWVVAQEADTPTFIGTDEDVAAFKSYMGIDGDWKIIYGNGFPITISKSEGATADNQVTISFSGEGAPGSIQIEGDTQAIVFGGSKEKDLNGNTSITMNSGKVGYLIGGGWGTYGKSPSDPKTANVQDVTINVTGGTVGLIYSGGLYRANVDDIHLTFKNATASHIYCGGFDQGQTTNTIETSWDSSVNHVTSSTLEMDNATVKGYLFLGGGQGYSYSKTVNATISNSTLWGGVLGAGSNGRSDNVTAVLNNVTFAQAEGSSMMIEIAALNRGVVGDVDMTFNGCTFPSNTSIYKCYAGATYQYDGKSTVSLGKVTMTFTDNTNTPTVGISSGLDDANVTINGAPVEIAAFDAGNSITDKDFTIATDKTWAFNNGLTIADGVTLTNNGTLEVRVSNADQLAAAVKAGANKVTMAAGDYVLSSQLTINKAITLEGSLATNNLDPATTIKANTTINWPTTNSKGETVTDNTKANLISIVAGNAADVTLKNIRVQESKAAGINVQTASKVTLENVACENNTTAGLLVHAPVEATNFHTGGNKWGGVNIDEGKNGESDTNVYNPTFKFDANSTFAEPNKVWSELATKNADAIVTLPEGNTTWRAIKGKNEEGTDMWYWTNAKLTQEAIKGITYVYANGNPVTVSAKENEADKIIIATADGEQIEATGASTVLYGGSKNASVENTSITINSGTIKTVFGGGYGESSSTFANVTTANIAVHGGEVAYLMVGGGKYYAKTGTVNITMDNSDAIIDEIYAGGYDAGETGNTITTPLNESNNGVNKVNITLTAGTMRSAIGLGGGQGYTRTGKSIIRVSNVKLGGILATDSNGHADDIDAKFKDCTFGDGYKSIASINRGMIDKATFVFEDCTFANDIEAYIGAGSGWANSDTNGTPTPEVTESISYEFKNCQGVPTVKLGEGLTNAHVTVTGAPVQIEKFYRGSKLAETNQYLTAFEIAAGKTWTFNNGLTFATEEGQQATLTNNGTLIVKGVTEAADLKALVTSKANEITTTLAGEAVGTALATSGMGSTNVIYASDTNIYDSEEAAKAAVGSGKAIAYLNKLDENSYELKYATNRPTIDNTKLTASSIEVGQTLSASILTGGSAKVGETVVAGTFSWKNPNTTINESGKQIAVFTPTDLHLYSIVEVEVEVTAIQYYTVTVGKSANGKVTITEGANAANKYLAGKVLKLQAEADPHYVFESWGDGITDGTYTVSSDKELTAKFKEKTFEVTIAGNMKVFNGESEITDNAQVQEGTVLTVIATPGADQVLASLTCNGNPIINNQVTVNGNLSLKATYGTKLADTYLVTVDADTKNGKVQLYDTNGNLLEAGKAYAQGTEIKIVAVPDLGYEAGELKINNTVSTSNSMTVGTEAITISQTFNKKKFAVTLPNESTDHATVTLTGAADLAQVEYGTVLTVESTSLNGGYKLLGFVANGQEITTGSSFTVTSDVTIKAVTQELPEVQFMGGEQAYTYTGSRIDYVAHTIPAGLAGVTLVYKQNDAEVEPINAGEYKVYASREGDQVYATLSNKEIGTLKIEKAPAQAAIPTPDQVDDANGTDSGKLYKWKSNPAENDNFGIAVLKNVDGNHYSPEYHIPASTDKASSLSTFNVSNLRATGLLLTLDTDNKGSIELYNGETKLTNTSTLYAGQTITVKAIPNAGYSSLASWSLNGTQLNSGIPSATATITMPNDETTINAMFEAKQYAPINTLSSTVVGEYNGVAFGGATIPAIDSSVDNWRLFFMVGDVSVSEPTEAGEYKIIAKRDEDLVYKATTKEIGTLNIKAVDATVSNVVGSDIFVGSLLSESIPTGVANVDGTFEWTEPTKAMTTVGDNQSVGYKFTPNSPNYKAVTGTATVNVKALATGVTTRQLTLTVTSAENGTVKMTLDGTEVTSGTAIRKDQVLNVTATANSGYSAAVKINGESKTQLTIGETGDVAVTVTFTENSTPVIPGGGGGTVTPEPEIPTVSNPVVAERTATTAAITWEKVSGATSYKLFLYAKKTDSTPLKTYEFDKDGKLKATTISFTLTGLEEGKSYYIETAAYNALGTLLVKKSVELSATPTGIEAISEGSQLYTVKGAIVVAPAEPLQVAIYSVTGQMLFNDEVSYLTQVPAKAGIYVVVIQKGNERITEKVFVK